jgi:hypothetical protein
MLDLTSTFVIAEIGVNHNGSIKLAKEMISSAKKALAGISPCSSWCYGWPSERTPVVSRREWHTD